MKKKLDSELVQQLRNSRAKVGALLPILVSSKTNRIIEGVHRFHADKKWPVVKLDLDEKQSLVARLALNAIRHGPDSLDVNELAALLVKDGIKYGNIAKAISDSSGVSYNTVLSLLDSGFKKQTHHQYSKEDKAEIGERFRRVAANKRMNAEHEPIANVESAIESAESRVDEAVKRHQNETAQAYNSALHKDKTALYFSLVTPLSALCDASAWIVDMSASEITKNYQDLTANERIAVGKKLEYLQANVMKLAEAFKRK